MKRKRLLTLFLLLSICVVTVQTASAATKYTKVEKKLANSLADFQDSELIDPDSFKIKHIYRVNYVMTKENQKVYKAYGILNAYKTIKWEVEYIAKNSFGGTVKNTVYISSSYYYVEDDDMDFDEYIDKTNYINRNTSKKFLTNVKKLTKKYYNEA